MSYFIIRILRKEGYILFQKPTRNNLEKQIRELETENEIGIIKSHPKIGYDILKGIEFSCPIAQTVFQHHERMDGSGYPRGLSGEEILMEARILAVADVVEAMSSFRLYRIPLGINKALAEISGKKGILYDRPVVEACLKCFKRKGFKFK
jgi:HD-GYP domain-containing protein (c-di-GMP phosphodiesterase class II)